MGQLLATNAEIQIARASATISFFGLIRDHFHPKSNINSPHNDAENNCASNLKIGEVAGLVSAA